MCRWSGQLGPKVREGDRQVPEGFYSITPARMNPNSAYYLSFDVGYPNTYDRALGRTGGSIMVHGICSSAGCFSMTDEQIAEIYAIAREGFAGGQRAIQMQSYPFRMTAENLAKYRLDPNISFWNQLKEGADNFEVTKKDVEVGVCEKRYIFNAVPADASRFDATGRCPPLQRNEETQSEVMARQKRDEAKIAELSPKAFGRCTPSTSMADSIPILRRWRVRRAGLKLWPRRQSISRSMKQRQRTAAWHQPRRQVRRLPPGRCPARPESHARRLCSRAS